MDYTKRLTRRLACPQCLLLITLFYVLSACGEKIEEAPALESKPNPGPLTISVHDHDSFRSIEFRDTTGSFIKEILLENSADTIINDDFELLVKTRFNFIEYNPALALLQTRELTIKTDKLTDIDDPRSRYVLAAQYHFTLYNQTGDAVWSYAHVSDLHEPIQSRRKWSAIMKVPENGSIAALSVGSWQLDEPNFFKIISITGNELLHLDSLAGEPLDYPAIPAFSPSGEFMALRGHLGEDDYFQGSILFMHLPTQKSLLYQGPVVMLRIEDSGLVRYKHPDFSLEWLTMDLNEKLGLISVDSLDTQ